MARPSPTLAMVEGLLARLYLPGGEGLRLRDEDRKKARELHGLLAEIARTRPGLLVDAAAGHAPVGLAAVELLDLSRLWLIERHAGRGARSLEAAERLSRRASIELRVGDAADRGLWPERPDCVVGLHACGAASDAILDGAVAAEARWILLAPCCYANAVPFAPRAEAEAKRLGAGHHPSVRRRLVEALVDTERTLRLEAAGYEVVVTPFVAPTVTPHNLLWRARRSGEASRMRAAAAALSSLRG